MENNPKASTSSPEVTEPDFVWPYYLEETKSEAAAPTAFSHVETSLESAFKVGMKLEVPNPDEKDAFWLASVIMECGGLLSLRYAGYGDDRSADFWFNVKSGEFHPAGWCSSNHKKLWPPNCVLQKNPDVNALLAQELKNTPSIPFSENMNDVFMPIEQIKCGMKLEIMDEFNPKRFWIATIMQNVGGRLLFEYDVPNTAASLDVWLFYLSDRLFPIGHAGEHGYLYSPPEGVIEKASPEDWDFVFVTSLRDAHKLPFPEHLFEPKFPIEKHDFEEGMKLEAVNPENYTELCPATVIEVFDSYYFLIRIDTHVVGESGPAFCCHSNSPFIFPIKWAEENELELTVPKGYMTSKFSWDEYLIFCSATAVPSECFLMMHMNAGFESGMKLEAADPLCPSSIHVATIKKVAEPLMWIHFDTDENEDQFVMSSVTSFDIFPVGWCAINFYPLNTPSAFRTKLKVQVKEEPVESRETPAVTSNEVVSRLWCPKIYFNYRCFTGPLLSKGRLAELPQAIGPGPLRLVLTEVIYRVVNIAYKSSRVLQILEIEDEPTPGMEQQVIKAKYKGKIFRATIEVITNSEQVEEFCKNICSKLECCPYLFSPKHVGEVCPISCHTQSKSKFGNHLGKKRKRLGRPPLANKPPPPPGEGGVKRGPGRKRKRKHWSHQKAEEAAAEKKGETSETTDDNVRCDAEPESTSPPGDARTDEEDAPKRDNKDAPKRDNKDDAPRRDNKDNAPRRDNKDEGAKGPVPEKKNVKLPTSSGIVTRGAKLPNFGLWHHHGTSFHSRRGRPRKNPVVPFGPRKVGRPVGSTKKAMAQLRLQRELEEEEESMDVEEYSEPELEPEEPPKLLVKPPLLLESNPLEWSVEDVVQYLQKTEYAPLAPILKDQEIDGQALLMLNLFSVQEYLHLKPEPAEKFCYLIKDLKIEFFSHYVS